MRLGKHKVEIALLLLVPALAIWLFFFDRGSVTTREAEMRKRNLLTAFRRDQIEQIAFERDGSSFRLVKRIEDGDAMYYVVRDGKEEIADQTAVDRLISTLEFAVPERRIDETMDRQALGLDQPKLRMKLGMGRIDYELVLGADAPSPKGAVYAELRGSGEGAFVLPRDLATQLSLSENSYRSRTLLPYLSPDLERLHIDGPGGERHFVRGTWGGWELDGTPRIRADREMLDRVLFTFADIRAEAFLKDDEADRALAEDHVTITMVPRETSRPRGVVKIGGACPDQPESVVVVREEPSRISACAPRGVMQALTISRDHFEDKHLFSFRPDEIEELAFTEGDRKLELARKGSGWQMRSPKDGDVEADAGNALARTLHGLEALRIVRDADREALGLSSPRALATVSRAAEKDDDPGMTEVVEIGATKGNFVYARRKVDDVVLELGRDAARALEPNLAGLQSRTIVNVPLARVKKVSVTGEVRQTIERTPQGFWSLKAPSGYDTDPAVAVAIVDALRTLKADRWVAEKDDGSFGLAKPRAIYEIEVEGEKGATESIRILVGEAAGGGHFAKREGQDGVFVLPRAIARKVESYAIDRAYFLFVPKEIRKVTLRSKGKSLTLVRSGERFVAEGDAITAERATQIVEELADLRIEGVVGLGAPRKEEGFDTPRLEIEVERQLPMALTPETVKVVVGAGDAHAGMLIHYARREGVDATFAMAQAQVRSILDAM